MHFPGVNPKQCEISRGDQEKVMWNFYNSHTQPVTTGSRNYGKHTVITVF